MFSAEERSRVSKLAIASGFEPAVILGFTQVESAGRSYWNVNGQRKPAIRPEGHYFYRLLEKKDKRLLQRAVSQGLASPKAGGVKVPRQYADVYKLLERMKAIDVDCAYESISMGVGQVMGEHYATLGYANVHQMWDAACRSLEGQVDIMLRFIRHDIVLANALQTGKWKIAAKRYNGPGYAKNKYDTKLEAAVTYYRGHTIMGSLPDTIDAERIKKLGYNDTKDFQEQHGLVPDGDIGPMTRDAVNEIEDARKKPARDGTGAAIGTGGGILAGLLALQEQITELLPVLDIFKDIGTYGPLAAATVLGAAIVGGCVYGIYKYRHQDALA